MIVTFVQFSNEQQVQVCDATEAKLQQYSLVQRRNNIVHLKSYIVWLPEQIYFKALIITILMNY
jgi:hypothetical protein